MMSRLFSNYCVTLVLAIGRLPGTLTGLIRPIRSCLVCSLKARVPNGVFYNVPRSEAPGGVLEAFPAILIPLRLHGSGLWPKIPCVIYCHQFCIFGLVLDLLGKHLETSRISSDIACM